MALTARHRAAMHEAILAYLMSQGEQFAESAAAFQRDAGDLQVSEKAAKQNLLAKKWTSVVRLQRKVMELEAKCSQLQSDMDTYGGTKKFDAAMAKEDAMPKAPAKHVLKGHRGQLTCVAFHPTFSVLVTSAEDAAIKFWDFETGEFERTVKGHTNIVNHVAFNSSGSLLASASADLSIKLWNIETYTLQKTLMGHDHNVMRVGFLPEGAAGGDRVFSCSRDKTIRLWDPSSGYCVSTLSGHRDWVRDIVCSDDGSMLASCSTDQSVILWKVQPAGGASEEGAVQHLTLSEHEHVVEAVCFSSGKADAVLGLAQAEARGGPAEVKRFSKMLDKKKAAAAKAKERAEAEGGAGGKGGGSLLSSGDGGGDYVASASRDLTVRIWESATGACVLTLRGHDNWVRGLAFHASGKYLFSCSDDRSIKAWDLSNSRGRCKVTIADAHDHFVTCISVCQRAPLIASGSVDNSVHVWQCR